MATKLNKYSRSTAAKIVAYVAVISCVCLIARLLGGYMFTYNSGLEAAIREEYYNSYAYYGEVEQALSATAGLLLMPESMAAPTRAYGSEYYFYAAYNNSKDYDAAFIAAEKGRFSGYIYGWQDGGLFAARLQQGEEQPLPREENGILSYLTNRFMVAERESLLDATVFVIFTDELLSARQQAWEAERAELLHGGEWLLALALASIPLLVYLGLVTGRRPDDEELHIGRLDTLHSELLIFMFLLTVLGGGTLWLYGMEIIRAQIQSGQSGMPLETLQLLTIASVIYVGLLTWFAVVLLNTLVRKYKARCLWRHSLIYRLLLLLRQPLSGVARGLRGLAWHVGAWCVATWNLLFVGPEYSGSDPAERLFRRQRRFLLNTAVAVGLMIFFLLLDMKPLFLLCLLAEVVFVYYFLRHNRRDMAEVRWSVEHSMAEQMKSEKLKIDLVTNVSHDLKTPLTSIISYVDLLAKEDGLNPVARDYVQVLGEKSQHLNRIVSDLFDLAKATSGNIPLDIELLDFKRLFAQTLADMEDSIGTSGMQIRSQLPEQPLLVLADGGRLYRVLQNVLDNAFKYAMPGSRIYVELYQEQGRAVGVVKNTASYEMNFTAEDIMQRFSRGDAARSSEGSGLGLAIAKSFCEACGGNLSVIVDGDQFKAVLDFPLAGQEE